MEWGDYVWLMVIICFCLGTGYAVHEIREDIKELHQVDKEIVSTMENLRDVTAQNTYATSNLIATKNSKIYTRLGAELNLTYMDNVDWESLRINHCRRGNDWACLSENCTWKGECLG